MRHHRNIFESAFMAFLDDPRTREGAPLSHKRRSGIFVNFVEGAYAQVFLTLTDGKFLTDLLLYFGASDLYLSVFRAMQSLFTPIQIAAAYLCNWAGSRRRVMIPAVILNRQIWWLVLPLIILPLPATVKLAAFFLIFIISQAAGQIVGNTWVSWTADLIPERIRGRTIGTRNALLAAVTIVADLVFSMLRDATSTQTIIGGVVHRSTTPEFLAVLFGTAAAAGLATVFLFQRQWEPPMASQVSPPLGRLLREAFAMKPMRRLIIAMVCWNASIGIAMPFWSAFFMKYLGLSFTAIMLYGLIEALLRMVLGKVLWGPVIDRAGSIPVLLWTGLFIAMLPPLYLLVSPTQLAFFWIDAVLTGILWSGFSTAAFLLPLQVAPSIDRAHYLAVNSTISGIATSLGVLAGGLISTALHDFSYVVGPMTYINYHVVFMLSATMRFGTLFLIRRVPDPRSRGMRYAAREIRTGVARLISGMRIPGLSKDR